MKCSLPKRNDIVYSPRGNYYRVKSVRHKHVADGLGWSLEYITGDDKYCHTTLISLSVFRDDNWQIVDKEMVQILHID